MDIDGPVFVIDEDTDAAARTTRALERDGYPSTVTTGRSTSIDEFDACACVVMEALFAGRDGIEYAQRLRAARPAMAIVIYTANGDEAVASRAISADVDEYVPKRDGPAELVDAVGRAIERRCRIDAGQSTVIESQERDLERYRTIVETVGDMIYALDDDGRLTYVNPSLSRYVGVRRSALIGTDVSELIPEDAYETGSQLIRSLLETDETNRGRHEFRIEWDDGTVRYLENNLALLFDECTGQYCGSVGIVRDVTDRTEQERILERQNERLEEFAGIVGHDLRNPLNVISGRVDLIRETGDKAHLDGIERCVDRMDALLSDLLALARDGKRIAEPEPVSLRGVATEAWQNVYTTNGSLELAEDLGIVEADRGRLRQCLENVFRNAVEHADADGPTVRIEALVNGFAISDDGPGIASTDAEKVFDRGFTTRRQGTGFGLSIVNRIVDAHGWSITVDETYDDGARFLIETDSAK